ncbi:hypothetical protein [Clostridium sp. C105KSO13]|uniref:hypothetical protein n=1 Tax=Clostridium sp. C105KSO13 TaxID=1776045 RepID=UPI0007406BCF|nr:hypothetical protein [Clostridium sp. C105KSO13]CUX47225.1 hypothetical protein BN3456_02652 [Clostridium sp. C105KSO13]
MNKETKFEKSTNVLQDYAQSKDAYDGNMDSPKPTEPLPESERPRKDGPGGE